MKKFLIALACCSLSACYYYVPAQDAYVEDVYTTPSYYGQTTYITPSTSHVYVEQQPDVYYINNSPDIVYIDSPAPHHHAPAPQRYHYPQHKHHKAAPQPKPHKEAAHQPKHHHDNHAKEAARPGFGGPEKVVKVPHESHGKNQPKDLIHHGGHKR